MPSFDSLTPDQKAVLQLVLKQGKSYEEIAAVLGLQAASVRERARAALGILGADAPGAVDLAAEQRDDLSDHLLRQQSLPRRTSSAAFLKESATGRAWARAVSAELAPISRDPLPDVPDEPVAATAPAVAEAGPREAAADDAGAEQPAGSVVAARADAAAKPAGSVVAAPADAAAKPPARSSRLGGMIVLAGICAVLVVGAVLLLRSRGDSPATSATDPAVVAADPAATGTTAALPDQQINLVPPGATGSKALGAAVVQQGALSLQTQGLDRRSIYVVWLWNSAQDALPLGYAKYVPETKRIAGSLDALPGEAVDFSQLVITRQPSKATTTPGPVVLGGPIRRS